MARSKSKLISDEKVVFLKFEIENGSSRRKKAALQELCRLCRQGDMPSPQSRNGLELSISGLVLSSDDNKVVRWCLNSLAQIGTRIGCCRHVEAAIKRYEDVPEIVAAAVAALSKIYNGVFDEVPILKNVQPEIRTLSALQNTDASKLDLSSFRIDIDTADVEILKLALITVGLNRDVENLFEPRHTNGQIIKVLGQYPDKIVRQYCVWSVIENNKLDLSNLGIPFSDLDNQPENVQSKLLQLAAERITDPHEKHNVLSHGTFLDSLIAREGLAKGLLKCHYDGIEDLVIPWFEAESEERVKLLLAEHMAIYSNISVPYEEKSLQIAENGGEFRKRILLGAIGRPLYRRVKASSIMDGMDDFFSGSDDAVFLALTDVAINQHVRRTMKILILSASPKGTIRLRLDGEANDLTEKLALVKNPAIKLDIKHQWAVRFDQLQSHIINSKPEILNFSGHGGNGFLCFEDKDGNSFDVEGSDFAELIRLTPEIKCVVLNCCYSAAVAALIEPYVEAVIGCDDSIADEAAIAFSRAFYRALSDGKNFKTAFELAKNEIKLSGMYEEAEKYTFSSK